MRKLLAVLVLTLLVTGLAVAQIGNTNFKPTSDVLGAHLNGGRGCAGCHAPHSGGRGSGGVISVSNWTNAVTSVSVNATTGVITPTYGTTLPTPTASGTPLGDVGLWGTDPGPLQSGMPILYQSTGSWSGYTVLLGTGTAINRGNDVFTGIVTCLSCHDGNVSRGAMMSGQSYEQFYGLLPTGNLTNGTLYQTNSSAPGYQAIPTLLGNDGGTLGDYNNDHPVGPYATIGAAGGCGTNYAQATPGPYSCLGTEAGSTGLTLTVGSTVTGASTEAPPNYVVTASNSSQYSYFLANYGAPALKDLSAPISYGPGATNTNPSSAWVTCKTCHNQHSMSVYASGSGLASYTGAPINGIKGGTQYATYFFVNAPYNPGAPYNPLDAPSTMQFCRQCHFEFSNESYGLNTVGTAY